MNQSDLRELLNSARDDQEMAVEIAFETEDAANNFANLANQVVFDTTLDLQQGEEDITHALRNYAQNHLEMNIEATRDHVNTQLPDNVIQKLKEQSKDLQIQSIRVKDPSARSKRIILETR